MLVNDKTNVLHRSLRGLELVQVPEEKDWGAQRQEATGRHAGQVHAQDTAVVDNASVHVDAEMESGGDMGREWQWRYLQGGVCVIKSLRSGWSRASALAADAASSAQELLEQSSQEPLSSRPPSERAPTSKGKIRGGAARKSAGGLVEAQVDHDCVWVEREPIPWQTSSALDESEFRSMFDASGVISDLDTLRSRAYYGGLAPGVRREAWKWLLGCYPAKSTRKDREALLSAKRQEYLAYKQQWQSITPAQQARFAKVSLSPLHTQYLSPMPTFLVLELRGLARQCGVGRPVARGLLLVHATLHCRYGSPCHSLSHPGAPRWWERAGE